MQRYITPLVDLLGNVYDVNGNQIFVFWETGTPIIPVAESINISWIFNIGKTITANYTYVCEIPEWESIYKRYVNGSEITWQNTKQYIIKKSDLFKKIKFSVKPISEWLDEWIEFFSEEKTVLYSRNNVVVADGKPGMYIAYLKTPQGSDITQIYNLNKFTARLKLNYISEATFELPSTDPALSRANLKEFNQIKITYLLWNLEQTVIEWVIKTIESDLDWSVVTINSFDYLFKRKKTYVQLDLNWNLTTFLQSVLDTINARYNTGLVLDCNISDTVTLGTSISAWTSFYDILKKIPNIEWSFTTIDNITTLLVRRIIWEDRTTGDNFVEYIRDINNPRNRSIKTAKHVLNADNLSNAVNDSYNRVVTDTDSITDIWRIEESVSVSWTNTIEAYLTDHKTSVAELEITPKSLDFFQVNMWDLVKVYIYVGNDILYYNWSLKVVSKTVSWNNLKKITIWLSKWNVTTLWIIETIKDLKDRLKLVELK